MLFNMTEYLKQALRMFTDAGGVLSGRHVSFPYKPMSPAELVDPALCAVGHFKPVAASLLMKLLYCARMCRGDLQFTVCSLSRRIVTWDVGCDQQLTHLFNYVASSIDLSLLCTTNAQDYDDVELHLFPDADLAGASDTSKSTSGCWAKLVGRHGTNFAVDWFSKLQTSTSHSTPEAELVALSKSLRDVGLPLQELLSCLLDRPVKLVIHEDNESAIKIVKAGYSQAMRHANKTHRICVGLVHECCEADDVDLRHIGSKDQLGDLLTKGLSASAHAAALVLANLVSATDAYCCFEFM